MLKEIYKKDDTNHIMKGFLSEQEKATLKEMHLDVREKRLADRIKTILLLDKGFTYLEITRILLIDEDSIRRHERRYQEGGVENLLILNYKGYEGKLSCPQEEELKQYLREHLMRSAQEVAGWIKHRYGIGYTPEGLVHLLHRLGFSYKKTKQVPAKADRQKQQAFVERYNEIKKGLGEKDKVYFVDAVHPQHNSMPAYGWIETGHEKEVLSNTGRQRLNINGALDVQTEEVILRDDERINAQSTIELFKQIEGQNPEAERIFVIVDNARYHRSRKVREFLETSKIKIEFLPPYSPNLNLIERLWKFFKQKILRGQYYEKFTEFREKILDFFYNIAIFREELKLLLTENFQLIGA